MDETCLGTRMVSWEKGRKKWTKLFDPNYIAGNKRNYVTRMISRQMDET